MRSRSPIVAATPRGDRSGGRSRAFHAEPAPVPATSFTWGRPGEPASPLEAQVPTPPYLPVFAGSSRRARRSIRGRAPEPGAGRQVVRGSSLAERPAFYCRRDAVAPATPVPIPVPTRPPAQSPKRLSSRPKPLPRSSRRARRRATHRASPTKSKKKKRKRQGSRAGAKARERSTQIVGVRAGSSQIVAAVVRNSDRPHELLQLVSAPLERGIIVGGEVREPEALAAELKGFSPSTSCLARASGSGSRATVSASVCSRCSDRRSKLFENAIRFHAQELLPIPLGDAILDHVVLGETAGPRRPAAFAS